MNKFLLSQVMNNAGPSFRWITDFPGGKFRDSWRETRPRSERKEHSGSFARFPAVTNYVAKTGNVITTPDEVSPGWVSSVLQRAAAVTNLQVSSVKVLLLKELQVSTVYRLGLSYEAAVDERCPRSLFLKLPRVLRQDARVPGSNDHAEIEFYMDVAPRIGSPPLIRCYDAAYSDETGRSHLVLEDLTETHTQPKQGHVPSKEMSRLAVEAIAKAHSACWKSSISDRGIADLQMVPGRKFDDEALEKFVENLKESVPEFLKAAELTTSQRGEYHRMLDAAHLIWGRMTRSTHLTVTHGDLHWWNFLYPRNVRTHSVHVFDWQLSHIDLGARDLAFLIALGGFAEPRPELEEELLRVYHHALGVADYSWDMLIEDYRWSAIRNLNIPVIFHSQGKHYSTWQTALRRAWSAYERLGCSRLI